MLKVMHKCKEKIVVGGYSKIEFRIAEGGGGVKPYPKFFGFLVFIFLKPSLILLFTIEHDFIVWLI